MKGVPTVIQRCRLFSVLPVRALSSSAALTTEPPWL
jgi:hypothetical protein